MGLMQKAVETYDCFADIAGIEFENRATLAPIGHITVTAPLEITLDGEGRFLAARAVDKSEPKIVIPVTETSAGRTSSGAAPHPLTDQLGYLSLLNKQKNEAYVEQLRAWVVLPYAHPKLQPILTYILNGTILSDLSRCGLIQFEDGVLKEEKALVRWIVNGIGDLSGPCWTDTALFQSFLQYYNSSRQKGNPTLCLISGQMDSPAQQHPKGVIPMNGNAKLISANDAIGFTYRGRFTESWQAATISYTASQKAHNALRWVAANQGVSVVFGGRTFLCWSPQGIELPRVTGAMGIGRGREEKAVRPSDYRQRLLDALNSWKTKLPAQAGVVIAAFDAATTGRLAVTYYNELPASDFLQRLYDWDATCCAENGNFGIQSPTLYDIATYAMGSQRDGTLKLDDRLLRQQMQRLVTCRVDRAPFPMDIERGIVQKASRLLIYNKIREELLFTACAVIRKYHFDLTKEEYPMALDENNPDRSYLFGRLLALAEAVERSTYDGETGREPNALRMQAVFAQRPLYGWRALETKLIPYYEKLEKTKPGLLAYYRTQIQQIVEKLSPDQTDLNQRLDDVYLLGYYHQRAYRRNQTAQTEE